MEVARQLRENGESCGVHLHAGGASTLAKRRNDPEGLSAAVPKLLTNDPG